MTNEELLQIQIEQEKQLKKRQLEQVIQQLFEVQSETNDLLKLLGDLKSSIESGLLVDEHILKEDIYNKIVNNSTKINSNTTSAISVVNSEINNL